MCGVPAEKTRTISSAVDKLDKLPWEDVKKEMCEEKGLDDAIADKIGEYVKLKGGEELLQTLSADATLTGNKLAKEGINEMKLLFDYLNAYGITARVCICPHYLCWLKLTILDHHRCPSIFHWPEV